MCSKGWWNEFAHRSMICVRSWRAVHWALKGWSHSWLLASPNSWRWRSRWRSPRSQRSLNLLVWRRMSPADWRMTERWEKIRESCSYREPIWSIAYKRVNKKFPSGRGTKTAGGAGTPAQGETLCSARWAHHYCPSQLGCQEWQIWLQHHVLECAAGLQTGG